MSHSRLGLGEYLSKHAEADKNAPLAIVHSCMQLPAPDIHGRRESAAVCWGLPSSACLLKRAYICTTCICCGQLIATPSCRSNKVALPSAVCALGAAYVTPIYADKQHASVGMLPQQLRLSGCICPFRAMDGTEVHQCLLGHGWC